ncbi:MAG: EAL domain-containing protein [Pseudomonadota bacterium]|nr:EAL domain-containing protein [Pseudomonadota bacterium]
MSDASDGAIAGAVRGAFCEGGMAMVFQPKIRLADGTLNSVEALLRWTDPALAAIGTERLVGIAEREGLIEELTRWGLRTTLLQWREWRAQGLDTRVAFNISAMSLGRLDFPDLVEAMCREHEVPAEKLLIELTEGATQPLVNLLDTLCRFRIKGIALALDDFGTGYSSLMQLHQLPFTEVKIDRSFIRDVGRSEDSRLIARTIVDLAHGLGMTVTAEGIETAEQLALLRGLGCDLGQGYWIAPPMPAAELEPWKRGFESRWDGSEGLALWSERETPMP